MTMETFYFERDPNFSTICDFKVAKIVANEMLRIYLNPLIFFAHESHESTRNIFNELNGDLYGRTNFH